MEAFSSSSSSSSSSSRAAPAAAHAAAAADAVLGDVPVPAGLAALASYVPLSERLLCEESTATHDVEDVLAACTALFVGAAPPADCEVLVRMLCAADVDLSTPRAFDTAFTLARRAFARSRRGARSPSVTPRKSALLAAYRALSARGEIAPHPALVAHLVGHGTRSHSGVLVVTVCTSPYPRGADGCVQPFSCAHNCYYCPDEPAHAGNSWTPQPRSYIYGEPSVTRANRVSFDPVLQFFDRAAGLAAMGHPVDKVELLVLGGTWSCYPPAYQESFIRDLFFAANTFLRARPLRAPRSLAEEKALNARAACKIVGVTLETRPDAVTPAELVALRRFGCTRVQLGVQHTDDAILRRVNRGCTTAQAAAAARLLKDAGFKIDAHLMPNLPGSDPARDAAMFERVLADPDLQFDQWKIYPCEVTPWSVIRRWYDAGLYTPYGEDALVELLLRVKARIHPWIRINRVVRDIPLEVVSGGAVAPNLRQTLVAELARRGTPCRCMRCREIRRREVRAVRLVVHTYSASGGTEHFISFETDDVAGDTRGGGSGSGSGSGTVGAPPRRDLLVAFCRLRLSNTPASDVFPELAGAALVRELHVYGKLVPTTLATTAAAAGTQQIGQQKAPQHTGLGRALLAHAESTAARAGFRRIAVIAGVGVRDYYARLGYELQGLGEYMVKTLPAPGLFARAHDHPALLLLLLLLTALAAALLAWMFA